MGEGGGLMSYWLSEFMGNHPWLIVFVFAGLWALKHVLEQLHNIFKEGRK